MISPKYKTHLFVFSVMVYDSVDILMSDHSGHRLGQLEQEYPRSR